MLILNSQHGFHKGRSCLSNLLVFLDKVTGSIDSGEAVDVIFMDFAKAFDKVPHIRLGRIKDETDIHLYADDAKIYKHVLVRQIDISYICHCANCMTGQTRGCSL